MLQGVQHAHAEIDGELQSRFAGCGLDPFLLLEQQDAEAVEAGVLQREAVLGFVHAEAAGAAGAGGEEDVIIRRCRRGDMPCFLQALQILHQVADREVSRVALAVVAELLSELEGVHIGRGHHVALVSRALEDGLNHLLVLPGKPAEQDRDFVALLGREGPFDRLTEMVYLYEAGVLAQAHSLGCQPQRDLIRILNGGHRLQLIRHESPLQAWILPYELSNRAFSGYSREYVGGCPTDALA